MILVHLENLEESARPFVVLPHDSVEVRRHSRALTFVKVQNDAIAVLCQHANVDIFLKINSFQLDTCDVSNSGVISESFLE